MLIEILLYLLIPALYGAYHGYRGLIMWKKKKITVSVVSTVLMFIAISVYSMLHYRLPNPLTPIVGGVLSYFVCDWIYHTLREHL